MMILGIFLMLFSWLLCVYFATEAVALELSGAKQGCETKCGNLIVPYPFGIGIKCAGRRGLYIACNSSYNPPRAYIMKRTDLEIVGISSGEVRIKNSVAYSCYNKYGELNDHQSRVIYVEDSPYTISDKSNRFVSVGCNTVGIITGFGINGSVSGCISLCDGEDSVVNGSCSGIGCCQTSISKGLKSIIAYISNPYNSSHAVSSPCSYAFLADQHKFNFQASDISDSEFINKIIHDVPMVLDWVIENITCKVAKRNLSSYACMRDAECVESGNGPGYSCRCKKGYKGNPYLAPGCEDVNECEGPNNPCFIEKKCVNLPGTYECSCPRGMSGDGRKSTGGRCTKLFPATAVILGIGLGLLFLLAVSCFLYFALKKRREARQKAKFFKQNGGLLLQQHQITSHEGGAVRLTRIYTAAELKEATNNYDDSRILGRGGNGTVYKGIFPGERVIVAIKKSRYVDETQIEQFINEVVILTQINHRNVVKLLGCCLETEVPLLVYEYISNGTLYEHLHNRKKSLGGFWSTISWPHRLRIATETAGALAYLHSTASIPIIHRDVKSANILLDDNFKAKVADFGASRLNPLDQTQISTLIQGTMGYLDPEYLRTSQLTEKSDVYSFGVVLVELLTGEKPLSSERSEEQRNLATSFIISMRENALLQIVEENLVGDTEREQVFAVAELAMRCLDLRGEVRPTMKEVVGELESLRRTDTHLWVDENKEATTYLLDESSDLYPITTDTSLGGSSVQYSQNDSMMMSLNLPR